MYYINLLRAETPACSNFISNYLRNPDLYYIIVCLSVMFTSIIYIYIYNWGTKYFSFSQTISWSVVLFHLGEYFTNQTWASEMIDYMSSPSNVISNLKLIVISTRLLIWPETRYSILMRRVSITSQHKTNNTYYEICILSVISWYTSWWRLAVMSL